MCFFNCLFKPRMEMQLYLALNIIVVWRLNLYQWMSNRLVYIGLKSLWSKFTIYASIGNKMFLTSWTIWLHIRLPINQDIFYKNYLSYMYSLSSIIYVQSELNQLTNLMSENIFQTLLIRFSVKLFHVLKKH
jgi:hypothetical protein